MSFFRHKTAQPCHLSVLRMNQTEECALKHVFDVITSYGKRLLDFLAGLTIFSLVTGLSYYLIIVLLQELTVFLHRLHVYFTSMSLLLSWVRYIRLFSSNYWRPFENQLLWRASPLRNLKKKYQMKWDPLGSPYNFMKGPVSLWRPSANHEALSTIAIPQCNVKGHLHWLQICEARPVFIFRPLLKWRMKNQVTIDTEGNINRWWRPGRAEWSILHVLLLIGEPQNHRRDLPSPLLSLCSCCLSHARRAKPYGQQKSSRAK